MTLISYINRAHVGYGLLEEAIRAELEANSAKRVALIVGNVQEKPETLECLKTGISGRSCAEVFDDREGLPEVETVNSLVATFRNDDVQSIVACGPTRIMCLAKAVALTMSHDRALLDFAETSGGAIHIRNARPHIIAIPSLTDFFSGLNGHLSVKTVDGKRVEIESARMIPDVTICDPTLFVGDSEEVKARAVVAAAVRCIEALLSPGYNPPADGIAIEGLHYAAMAKKGGGRTSEDICLDILTASVNAALVQRRGVGVAHAIGCALRDEKNWDGKSLGITGLVLPPVLAIYDEIDPKVLEPLMRATGASTSEEVTRWIKNLVASPALPGSLNEIGISSNRFSDIAQMATRHRALCNGPVVVATEDILRILAEIA